MAQQIKKKFLSPEVINYFDNQIDAVEQSVLDEKGRAEGQEASIRSEFSANDDANLLEAKSYAEAQDALKLAEAKEYAELKVAEAKSEIMGGIPDSTLDTIAEIASALSSEQTATGAILTQLGDLEANKASKTELSSGVAEAKAYADQKISEIPAVDLTPYETIVNVDSKDAAKLVEAKAYTDLKISEIPAVDLTPYETIANVDSKDSAKLAEAKAYADSKFSDEQASRLSGDADLQGQLDNLDGYSQEIRSDVDGHETRIVALEARVDGPFFSNEKMTVGEELGFVELSMEVKKIMSCAVGRLAVHEGEDFDVTVVGGKSRIVWKGSLLAPSGEECIETGMNVFVVYAY